jgi:ATP-dependent RNA helicase SUPV3L1/SUV3
VERIVQARFEDFELNAQAEILLRADNQRLARLKPGASILAPTLQLLLPDGLDKGARTRVERRLQAHVKDILSFLLAAINPPERAELVQDGEAAALRGLLYQLEQGLGSVRRQEVAPQLDLLRPVERAALARWGVRIGRASVFAQAMLQPERLRVREAHAYQAAATAATVRDPRCYRLQSAWDKQSALWRGYLPVGTWAVRCDLTERLIVEITKPEVDGPAIVQSLLGCDPAHAASICSALPKLAGKTKRRRNARKRRRRRQRDGAPQHAQEPSE